MHNSLKTRWPSLIFFILVVVIVQTAGNLTTMPSIGTWYASLVRPFWTPPNWVFGPVWTTLYVMIAVAGWFIWINLPGVAAQKIRSKVFILYALQILLNFVWSPLFFHYHVMGWALLDLGLLIATVIALLFKARPISKIAFYLLIPYLLWISYAFTLNAGFVYLN